MDDTPADLERALTEVLVERDALRARAAVLESLIDGLPRNAAIIGLDRRYAVVTGVTRAEIVDFRGVHPEEVEGLPNSSRSAVAIEPMFDVIRRGESGTVQRIMPPNPELPDGAALETTTLECFPVYGEDRQLVGMGVIFTDRLEDAYARQEARHAREVAERASREKSDFLARVSHELRTPMNAVLGFTQLLELEQLSPAARSQLKRISRAGEHLVGLIDDVLEINRTQAGRSISVEPVRVGPLLSETVDLLAAQARERGVDLVVTPADGDSDIAVDADRLRLRQVLVNLVRNAIVYNRPAGRVTVGVEVVGGMARIEIADTGPGVSEGDFERMFLPFERLDAVDAEGTGLGLALSRELARAMGGNVRVARSVIGEGTTMVVELVPSAAASDTEPSTESVTGLMASDSWDVGPARLLYVDDNPANLELVTHILARSPAAELVTCQDGAVALELIFTHDFDAILLDLHLPTVDGSEILAQIRRDPSRSHTPVVMLSADADVATASRALDMGATQYVTKPFRVAHFLASVRSALQAGRPRRVQAPPRVAPENR